MFSTTPVSLSSLLYSTVSTLFWACLLFCVLVGFVFNWLIFLVSLAHQVTLTFCLWIVLVLLLCMYVCVYVCLWRGGGGWVCSFGFISICLILHLPFVWGTFFFLVFCSFVCFIPSYCHCRKNEEAVTKSSTQLSNNKLP